MKLRPHELTTSELDPTQAYLLDRAVITFGGFVDGKTNRFSQSSKEVGAGKSKKQVYPTPDEIIAYRKALITGVPYRDIRSEVPMKSLRPKKGKKKPLSLS